MEINLNYGNPFSVICSETMVIPPPSEDVRNFIKSWRVQIDQGGRLPAGKEVLDYARTLQINQIRTFKAKVVHNNTGSMRQRRARYYFHRQNKEVVIKTTMLKNVYPVGMQSSVDSNTGLINVNVQFAQGDPHGLS